MRGRDSVIVTPRASFLCEMNCEPLAAYRCAITIVPLTRHAISDRVYYATYLSIGVLRQCRTTACAPSEEEEAGRRMFGRARFRVSVLLLVRFLSSRRITAAYQCQGGSTRFSVCVCVYRCRARVGIRIVYENATPMMHAIDAIDRPFFPFLEVVSSVKSRRIFSKLFILIVTRIFVLKNECSSTRRPTVQARVE